MKTRLTSSKIQNQSIIYSSESAKASMTSPLAYHSYKIESLHPFCEYDFIVSTQITPTNDYGLNQTRFVSSGVKAKGKESHPSTSRRSNSEVICGISSVLWRFYYRNNTIKASGEWNVCT